MVILGEITQIDKAQKGGTYITLYAPYCTLEDLKQFETDNLTIEIKKYREKRSTDANAYFHVLVGKIADVLRISKVEVKNRMINHYGQAELIDGKPVCITTQLEPDRMLKNESLHATQISVNVKNDKTFYSYMVMRGSHTYNTKEMSILIDGTVQEAKDLGIETLPPYEIERLKAEWNTKNV